MRIVFSLALFLIPLSAAAQDTQSYWKVMGVGGGMRARPLAGAAIVARPATGTVVKNVSCETSAGRKWCQVELLDQPGVTGWIGATNLLAAAPPEG